MKIRIRKIAFIVVMLLLQAAFVYAYYINQDSIPDLNKEELIDGYFKIKDYLVGKSAPLEIEYTGNDAAQSVPVLLYHGILTKPDGSNVLIEDFKDQMYTLKREGYQTISIEDFEAFMEEGKKLPPKSFLLTFDDGRKDSYYPADPILKELDYTAVMFAITGRSMQDDPREAKFHLVDREVKRMYRSGRWGIQAHTQNGHDLEIIDENGTLGHFYTNLLWLEQEKRLETEEELKMRVENDIIGAKKDIEDDLKNEVVAFAFPFGDYGERPSNYKNAEEIIMNATRENYKLAFYQIWFGGGFTQNYVGESDFLMKRINIYHEWKGMDLVNVLKAGEAKNENYTTVFDDSSGWLKNHGNLKMENNTLQLTSSNTGTSALVFLDGTYAWKDYLFTANISSLTGQTFSLVARFTEPDTYYSCDFYIEGRIELTKIIHGKRFLEKKIRAPRPVNKNIQASIAVKDNEVSCTLGKTTLKDSVENEIINQGGIGIKVWDPSPGRASVVVDKIEVFSI